MKLRISQFPPEQAFAKGLQPNALYHEPSASKAKADLAQLLTSWDAVPNAVATYCDFFNLAKDCLIYVWEEEDYHSYRTYEVTVRRKLIYTAELLQPNYPTTMAKRQTQRT